LQALIAASSDDPAPFAALFDHTIAAIESTLPGCPFPCASREESVEQRVAALYQQAVLSPPPPPQVIHAAVELVLSAISFAQQSTSMVAFFRSYPSFDIDHALRIQGLAARGAMR
jgi:hypothetical protein